MIKEEFNPLKDDIYTIDELELFEYSETIRDDKSKNIYLTILKTNIYNSSLSLRERKEIEKSVRESLAKKYNTTNSAISLRYNKVDSNIKREIIKERNKMFKDLIKDCYDENGLVSLDKISNYYGVDILELRSAFVDYCNSWTVEEENISSRSIFEGWSGMCPEAEKRMNIDFIMNKIKELKDDKEIKKDYLFNVNFKEDLQEKHFFKSINSIYEDYKKTQEKGIKTNYSK